MSYIRNKKNRLKTKYTNILMKDFGIIMSDSPTEMIVICNGGLCNGVTHEMISCVFNKFGLTNVFMAPGKSYAFVEFSDVIHCSKAYTELNGQVIWPGIKNSIHLGYVKNFNVAVLDQNIVFKIPPGLIVIDDFITEEEELTIMNLVEFGSENEKHSFELKHRRVKHFGYEFKYSTNNVNLNEPIADIPNQLNFLWVRLKNHYFNIKFVPDQLTVNCYEPGQGIPPHVDTHSAFEDGLYSLSLGSSIVMEFKNQHGLTYHVLLKRRSLCVMSGESRYDWTHAITPRKSDLIPNNIGGLTVLNREKRISLTFRKTRTGDCTCKFPRLCDSVLNKFRNTQSIISDLSTLKLGQEAASELEESYVHEVYDKIAPHFSETRHKPWPNVTKFINSFAIGSILVDVGCGNGKYFSKQNIRFELGCDSTPALIRVCSDKGFECFSCNCLNIPLRDNTADGCICIAVIHHLTTAERRRRALDEIIRILRKGGKALIYVWAKNQEHQGKKSSYLKQNCGKNTNSNCQTEMVALNSANQALVLPVHNNRTNFGHNDLLVPWKLKTKGLASPTKSSDDSAVYLRFYHVYENEELKEICSEIEGVKIMDYYYDQGNWCVILEKL